MTAYTTIINGQLDQDSPVTTPLLTALRDNPSAIAEGDAAAPRVNPVKFHVRDKKANGTAGGALATVATWVARTLNTVALNTITGASLASNQVTLPAGTYDITGRVPGNGVNGFQARLYSVTAGAVQADTAGNGVYGTSGFCDTAIDMNVHSVFDSRFTIASAAVFEVQMYNAVNPAGTRAAGRAVSATGADEIYSDITFEKVA